MPSAALAMDGSSSLVAPWHKLELLKNLELQIERSTPRNHGVQIVSPPRAMQRLSCSFESAADPS
jgi:hypothetical protein